MTDDITNLRTRVEALEVWRATTSSFPLTAATCDGGTDPSNWTPEATAAIQFIANWLDQQELHVAATRLRLGVEQ